MSRLLDRKWILIVVLTFLVTFGLPSYLQSARDTAIAEIKALAASDVENDMVPGKSARSPRPQSLTRNLSPRKIPTKARSTVSCLLE